MRISIITVCFNAAKTIGDAMESVASQRARNVRMPDRPIDAVREAALKPVTELAVDDKRCIVGAIESTRVVALRQPSDERMKRFIRGYWDGDAKVIREIIDWGGSVVPKRVENRYIGEIQTHRNAIRSILFHTRFRGPLKVLVLEGLEDILRDAVLYNKGKDGDETFYNLAHRLSFDPCDGGGIREFVARLIVKETADGNRTWTIEFSNKMELTGVPTTGEAATVEVTHLKPPSTHTILKWIYAVNGMKGPGVEIEHIVVDGGSTDGTVEEVKRNSEKVKSKVGFVFRWVSERDNGLYDAMNKGIRMATGDVVGILNADDVLAEDDTLAKIAVAFEDPEIDGTYADIRFVRELGGKTVRYCSGRWFRPWMFRFAVLPAHPSIYLRRSCFEKYGLYSLDYRICADFELMLRFIWKHCIRTRYLPLCTTVMRAGGLSTAGWRSNLRINREDLRALKAHGFWSCLPLVYLKYLFKVWGFVFRRSDV